MSKLLEELGSIEEQQNGRDGKVETDLRSCLESAGLTEVKYKEPYLETIYFLKLLQFIGTTNAALIQE